MTDVKTNFLGIPIDGTIQRADRRVQQRPREEFEPLVRALLDDPYIVEFGWRQYTPYFNDGDPCIFSAYGAWVRTQDQAAGSDGEDFEYDSLSADYGTHPSLGGEEGWGADRHYVGARESQWRVANAFTKAIDSGEFHDVLLDLFGDHCQVTVSRTGITVHEYSHD